MLLDRFDADCRDHGPATLLELDTTAALPLAAAISLGLGTR